MCLTPALLYSLCLVDVLDVQLIFAILTLLRASRLYAQLIFVRRYMSEKLLQLLSVCTRVIFLKDNGGPSSY